MLKHYNSSYTPMNRHGEVWTSQIAYHVTVHLKVHTTKYDDCVPLKISTIRPTTVFGLTVNPTEQNCFHGSEKQKREGCHVFVYQLNHQKTSL